MSREKKRRGSNIVGRDRYDRCPQGCQLVDLKGRRDRGERRRGMVAKGATSKIPASSSEAATPVAAGWATRSSPAGGQHHGLQHPRHRIDAQAASCCRAGSPRGVMPAGTEQCGCRAPTRDVQKRSAPKGGSYYLKASTESEIDGAFGRSSNCKQARPRSSRSVFKSRRDHPPPPPQKKRLVALAARLRSAIYEVGVAESGCLHQLWASQGAFGARWVGVYAGRSARAPEPADLTVQQRNLRTGRQSQDRQSDSDSPCRLDLARADEVSSEASRRDFGTRRCT